MSEQLSRSDRFMHWWVSGYGARNTVLSVVAGLLVNHALAGYKEFNFVYFALGALSMWGLASRTTPLWHRKPRDHDRPFPW